MNNRFTWVESRIDSGDVSQLIEILSKYIERIRAKTTDENFKLTHFTSMYLWDIIDELKRIRPRESVRDNPVLDQWARLTYFGIALDLMYGEEEEE